MLVSSLPVAKGSGSQARSEPRDPEVCVPRACQTQALEWGSKERRDPEGPGGHCSQKPGQWPQAQPESQECLDVAYQLGQEGGSAPS